MGLTNHFLGMEKGGAEKGTFFFLRFIIKNVPFSAPGYGVDAAFLGAGATRMLRGLGVSGRTVLRYGLYTGAAYGGANLFLGDGVSPAEAGAVSAALKVARRARMAVVDATGRAGELAAGIVGTKKGIIGPISGRMRFPDDHTIRLLKEVKNVKYQALSSQIRDYIAIARNERVPFELWVRKGSGTIISRNLQAAEDAGLLTIIRKI